MQRRSPRERSETRGHSAPDVAALIRATGLEHFHLCLDKQSAHSVCSPPPCGEGLGWGSFSGSPHDAHPGASRRPSPQGEGTTELAARADSALPEYALDEWDRQHVLLERRALLDGGEPALEMVERRPL